MTKNISEMASFFKSLGDPTRIKILNLLKLYSDLCVSMVAQKLGITQPAVSQHLRILKNAGILEAERTGFHMHYHINPDVFEKFGLMLDKIIDQDIIHCEMKEQCIINPKAVKKI